MTDTTHPTVRALQAAGLHPSLDPVAEAFAATLDRFSWSAGTVTLALRAGTLHLELRSAGTTRTSSVNPFDLPERQVVDLVHAHTAALADREMSWGAA